MDSNVIRSLDEEIAAPESERAPARRHADGEGRVIAKNAESRLYRLIWRWHFYAGMIVAPVLIVVSLTGGLYVFREELERIFYPRLMFVTPVGETGAYARQVAGAAAVAPAGARLESLHISADPTRASVVAFHAGGDRYTYVFVNQYTNAVQGQREYGDSFFDVVLKIHRTLWAGSLGRIVVELSTSWGIVLIVTGLYLWWPRRGVAAGVWRPRMRGKSYIVWRDWHAVPGFYLSLVTALIMATGLFFTLLFGRGYLFMAYGTKSYPASYVNPPKSSQQTGAVPITIDQVINIARQQQSERELYIGFPEQPTDAWSVYAGENASPSSLSQLYIDQYSGKVLDIIRWRQLSAVAKVQLSAYPIHIGSIYGLPTKILAALACLLIVAMSVTGAAMWLIRRPKGKTGFPLKPRGPKPAAWLIGVICLLGALMPAVGASLALIVSGDWLISRLRRKKRRNTSQGRRMGSHNDGR
jgi:uncharacterized iron-regulated membrane protein